MCALGKLNIVTTWNDITYSILFWKNVVLYTAGCNQVVIPSIHRISFWLIHLPWKQLKILHNYLSSFHCWECDSILATEIWEKSLNWSLGKNQFPHKTNTGGNLPAIEPYQSMSFQRTWQPSRNYKVISQRNQWKSIV